MAPSRTIRTLIALLGFLGALAPLAGCNLARLVDLRPVATVDGEPIEVVAAEPYARGKEHLQEGRFGFALRAFRAALVREPRSVRVLNALAVAYDQLGRKDLAARFFQQALDVDPTSPQTLNNLGYSMLRGGDPAAAIMYFQRALAEDADNPTIRANLEVADGNRAVALATSQRQGVRAVSAPLPRVAWVERTSRTIQTIITRPDFAVLEAAKRFAVEPRLASYQHVTP